MKATMPLRTATAPQAPGTSAPRATRKATMLLGAGALALVAGTAACAAGTAAGEAPPVAGAPATASAGGGAAPTRQEGILVPAGFGTLRLDDITLTVRSEYLQVSVTPLAESVTRLAASDIYERLHASARSAAARGAAEGSALFLVSFFSDRPDVPFQPEDLQLLVQGRLHRATRILPTTPGWTRQRLAQQESQSAVYAFDADVDLEQGSVVVRYGTGESDDWSRIVPRLQEERARVRARAGGN